MNSGFSLPAQLMGIRSLADGGLSLGFHSAELSKEEKVRVMDYHLQAGWLLFSPEEVSEDDIPVTAPYNESRSPSQRLRAVLFLIHKQSGSEEPFNLYYDKQMERIIDHLKGRIE